MSKTWGLLSALGTGGQIYGQGVQQQGLLSQQQAAKKESYVDANGNYLGEFASGEAPGGALPVSVYQATKPKQEQPVAFVNQQDGSFMGYGTPSNPVEGGVPSSVYKPQKQNLVPVFNKTDGTTRMMPQKGLLLGSNEILLNETYPQAPKPKDPKLLGVDDDGNPVYESDYRSGKFKGQVNPVSKGMGESKTKNTHKAMVNANETAAQILALEENEAFFPSKIFTGETPESWQIEQINAYREGNGLGPLRLKVRTSEKEGAWQSVKDWLGFDKSTVQSWTLSADTEGAATNLSNLAKEAVGRGKSRLEVKPKSGDAALEAAYGQKAKFLQNPTTEAARPPLEKIINGGDAPKETPPDAPKPQPNPQPPAPKPEQSSTGLSVNPDAGKPAILGQIGNKQVARTEKGYMVNDGSGWRVPMPDENNKIMVGLRTGSLQGMAQNSAFQYNPGPQSAVDYGILGQNYANGRGGLLTGSNRR